MPQNRRKRRSLGQGHVNVTIGTATLHMGDQFSYEEDPKITDVYPRTSFISGGLLITVVGSNLHVVDQPQIAATVVGQDDKIYIEDCTSSEDGYIMKCKSPHINATEIEKSSEILRNPQKTAPSPWMSTSSWTALGLVLEKVT